MASAKATIVATVGVIVKKKIEQFLASHSSEEAGSTTTAAEGIVNYVWLAITQLIVVVI